MSRKIIFICTGNTCRSSMAEALAKDILAQKVNVEAVEIASFGVAAWPGSPAAPQAVEVLGEQGIDLSSHRARAVDVEELREADLVLAMTAGHRAMLVNQVPEVLEKVFVLADYVGKAGDIPDPIGQPVEVYRECAAVLRDMIEEALDKFTNDLRE